MEKLAHYMKPVADADKPEGCKNCKYRYLLRWLLGQVFCEHSSYTRTHSTKRCDEFEGDYGIQLELF